MNSNIARIFEFLLFMFLSGLFSGSETGMYQLSRLRLRLGVEKKKWTYRLLAKSLSDSPGLLLSILLGNNLVNYLATGVITYVLLDVVDSESAAAVLTTVITAPVLFIFAELIPKNIFFYQADVLMPWVALPLYVIDKSLHVCGAVPFLKLISRACERLTGLARGPRRHLASAHSRRFAGILHDTREEGVLSSVQTDMIRRVIDIPSIRVASVMVPMKEVHTVALKSDRELLLNRLRRHRYTRWPVVGDSEASIVGYINIYEVLGPGRGFEDLREFIKPARRIEARTAVTDAIRIMQEEDLRMVIVTRPGRRGEVRPVGILTMKDLAEEVLGELAEW